MPLRRAPEINLTAPIVLKPLPLRNTTITVRRRKKKEKQKEITDRSDERNEKGDGGPKSPRRPIIKKPRRGPRIPGRKPIR